MPHRILIVTAAFGEGHNSAAKNMALAFEELGAEAMVADPCMLGVPRATKAVAKSYRFVTNYSPRLWHQIYETTGKVDFSRKKMPLMRLPERALSRLIEDFQPDVIVCTYPLYPYFLERIYEKENISIPVYTMVTDSIEINPAWLQAPNTQWMVTDQFTKEAMVAHGLDTNAVIETGFAVHPKFSRLTPLETSADINPFDVVYFTTPKLPQVRRICKAVLNASPDTRLTIVLGKNVRLLYQRAREIKERFPGRVRIKGWTRKVPELLASHHMVIGKAGGATVHEAIAAQCPMLVHHLVPGQEEGNLELLRKINGGDLAPGSEAIAEHTQAMLADNGRKWREMKTALAEHGRNNGAILAAQHILSKI